MAKNGFSMSNRVAVEEITATKTLTVDDCGKHFSVDTAGGAIVVTLPAIADAENGWNASFYVTSGSAARSNFTVSSTTNNVNLRGLKLAGHETQGSGSDVAVTNLVIAAAQQKPGDLIQIVAVNNSYEAMALTSGTLTTS